MADKNVSLTVLKIKPYEGSSNDLRLDLNYRNLQRIPHDLFAYTDLHWLNLNMNKLTFIPHDIRKLQKLKWLYLESNFFDEFPLEVCSLQNLVRLFFSCNHLRTIPEDIGKMTHLRHLDLSDNQFSEFPDELCNPQLLHLEKLFFDGNKISCLPNKICHLKGLKILWINDNRIEWLPQSICELEHLEELQLKNNCLRFFPSYFWSNLTNLKTLLWDGNPLLQSIQDHVGEGLEHFRIFQSKHNQKLEKKSLVEFRSEGRVERSRPCYRMRTRPRGVAVLIDNFSSNEVDPPDVGESSRNGADSGSSTPSSRFSTPGLSVESSDTLRTILIKLGFNVRVMRGLMSLDIISALRFVSLEDHSYFDCLIICILSRGQEGQIIGPDGISVAVEQLTDIFTRENCPSLADKPKLFFLQILDTHNVNRHPSQAQSDQEMERTDTKQRQRPKRVPKPDVFVHNLIPNDSDFLLTFALVPENAVCGSKQAVYKFYVEKLFVLLEKFARKLNLLDILTAVHDEVRSKRISTVGSTIPNAVIEPLIQSSLKYNLYLSVHTSAEKR